MKRLDFIKSLGLLPAVCVAPKLVGLGKKDLRFFNPTIEEQNKAGWYFGKKHWDYRVVGIRLPYRRNQKFLVTDNGFLVKRTGFGFYYESPKCTVEYSYPEFVFDGNLHLPKEARVCYDMRHGAWMIRDCPDRTLDQNVFYTWPDAPIVEEGDNIPIIGRVK